MNTPAVMIFLLGACAAQSPAYHFDLSSIFDSPADEATVRETVLARANTFARTAATTVDGAEALAAWLATYDALGKDLQRHEIYVYLRAERDPSDRADADADAAITAAIDAIDTAAGQVLARIDASALSAWAAHEPAIARYRYFIETKRHDAFRRGDSKAATLLVRPVLDKLGNAYRTFVRKVVASGSSAHATEDAAHAFQAKWKPYLDHEAAFAALLEPAVAAQDGAARLQGFAGAADAAYERAGVSGAQVARILAALRSSGAYRRYVAVVAAAAAQRLHIGGDAVRPWDLDAADAYEPAPVAFADGVKRILAAEHAIGGEYAAQFDRLFDPANGRVESCSGEKCDAAGFSVGYAGTQSGVFYGAYAGTTDNLRALAHEAGHAVHRELMNENQPIGPYNSGPHFLFESFAIFSGLLLLDDLYREAPTAAARAYYLHQFLDHVVFDIFGSARETELEASIYAGAEPGSVRDASDFDALTLKVFSAYTPGPALANEMKVFWARNRLYFTDPFYDVNYLYAGLLALEYLSRFEHDRDRFSRRYVALLKNGFTAPPQVLLRQFLDIDLNDTDGIIARASARIDSGTQRLAQLYGALHASP